MNKTQKSARLFLSAFSSFAHKADNNLLEVGCGNGDLVHQLRATGLEVFGTDIELKKGKFLPQLLKNKVIQPIKAQKTRSDIDSRDEYLWPNFDCKFNIIFSRATLEHVRNLSAFAAECDRQLDIDGVQIHYYPSKFSLIEPHTGVPFGAFFKSRRYHIIMCFLGLCFKKFKNRGSDAFKYMREFTSYRSQTEIDSIFLQPAIIRRLN